jgi:hypothetical protein
MHIACLVQNVFETLDDGKSPKGEWIGLTVLQCVQKVAVHLGYVTYVDLVISIEVAVKVCCCFTVFVCKQRLKCNTGKVCNCLIQLLLTMVHEKRIQRL